MWPSAVAVALLLQSVPLPGPGPGPESVDQRSAANIQALSKAAADAPKDYTAHFNLALAYSLAQRDAEAISEYRTTLELKPGLFEGNLNLGILLLRNNQAKAAVAVLEPAHEAKPQQFTAAFYLGEALLASGNPGAAAVYEAALKLDPKSAAVESGLAHALARAGQVDEAAPHFQRAAELDPRYQGGLLELADRYEAEKRITDAVALYSKLRDNAAAQERAGEILLESGKSVEAIPPLERSVELAPASANRLALATAYFGSKQPEKGIPILNDGLTADPQNYALRMLAGRVLRDQKQYSKAVTQFLQAAKIKADSLEAWDEAAGSLMLADDYSEAMAALDKVKVLGGEKPSHFYLRAIMLDKLKQYQPALDYYRRFLAASQGRYPELPAPDRPRRL